VSELVRHGRTGRREPRWLLDCTFCSACLLYILLTRIAETRLLPPLTLRTNGQSKTPRPYTSCRVHEPSSCSRHSQRRPREGSSSSTRKYQTCKGTSRGTYRERPPATTAAQLYQHIPITKSVQTTPSGIFNWPSGDSSSSVVSSQDQDRRTSPS
jgi:hypothetical protein